jgi:putative Holliday junction resolvase
MNGSKHLMALDLGDKRIGVAIASYSAKLPRPLVTLSNDDELIPNLQKLIKEHEVDKVIVGLPRSLEGNSTDQTAKIESAAEKLKTSLGLPMDFQDEALSSVRAKEELDRTRGQNYDHAEVDKLAACYILEDYLRQ